VLQKLILCSVRLFLAGLTTSLRCSVGTHK